MSTKLLTLDDVAQMIGASRSWVWDHATRKNPRLPAIRFGGKRGLLRFRLEDVEAFIAEHLVSSADSVVSFPQKRKTM